MSWRCLFTPTSSDREFNPDLISDYTAEDIKAAQAFTAIHQPMLAQLRATDRERPPPRNE